MLIHLQKNFKKHGKQKKFRFLGTFKDIPSFSKFRAGIPSFSDTQYYSFEIHLKKIVLTLSIKEAQKLMLINLNVLRHTSYFLGMY